MKHTWKQKVKCEECKATGIGKGSVRNLRSICKVCKGTGCREIKVEWEDFEGRIRRNDIKRVFEANPGIVLNEDPEIGGMLYEDWFQGKSFPLGSENRKYCCPAWWRLLLDPESELEWDECYRGLTLSRCSHFKNKDLCWEKWDKEFGGKVE